MPKGVRMLPKEILLTAKSESLTRDSAGEPRAVRPGEGRSEVSGRVAGEAEASVVSVAAARAAELRRGRLLVWVLGLMGFGARVRVDRRELVRAGSGSGGFEMVAIGGEARARRRSEEGEREDQALSPSP